MICPTCATPNPAPARFCMGCGQPLSAGQVCPQCFTLLPTDARFCFHCGAMVVGTVRELPMPPAVESMPARSVTPAPAVPSESVRAQARPLAELLASLKLYLPRDLYEPLERRPTKKNLTGVRDHLLRLLRTAKTYLPGPVGIDPQPAGHARGGMQQGTFLFVDVTGFTALSERLARAGRAGTERVAELMNDLFFELVRILLAHGGTLLKFGGDALLGVFQSGADVEVNDSAVLAVRASFAMQSIMDKFAAIEAAGETSALHIKFGISTGPYFAAHIGTPDNMGYVTTGHTVNRAEQCEDHAEPGEIIVSQSTFDLVKDQVGSELREAGFYHLLEFSGGDEPIPDRTPVIPDDDQPPGDVNAGIAYLVDRLDRLTPYLAADLLPRLVTNPDEVVINPEHRPVTVMFANYLGMSELIEDLGSTHPDVITQQLHRYFGHVAEIVEQYEGTLARMDHYAIGDRLVIFFGAPRAHEDDPLRAVYAALDMQAATQAEFSALQTPDGVYRFRQRIGINTGHLFAGNVGAPDLRQEYTLMGDDINMAARLMSKADWGDIFISQKTHERVAAYIELEDKGAIPVKGKTVPIQTYRVIGRRAVIGLVRGLQGIDSPLIGRDQALQAVLKCCDTAIAGRGQILAIIGDSGRGKSRLARELKHIVMGREETPSLRWLEAQALSFSEGVSYWLAAQFLREALGVRPDASPGDALFALWGRGEELLGRETARETIPFLAYLLDLPLEGEWATWVTELDPKARQKQPFWAMREFFTALAEQQPTVILLDDLHWADEASLLLLEDLLAVTDHAPLLLCLIFREMRDKGAWRLRDKADSGYAHRYTQVELEPLTDEQSHLLLGKLLPGAELSEATRQRILEKAAGNPFYLEEVVRSLMESGAVVPENGHWRATDKIADIAVPDNLHGAIVSRIDRLTEDARQALQIAAVIGRRFRLAIFTRLVGAGSDMESWLADLERGGLVRPGEQTADPVYDFPDALVQEVAYDSLLVQRRQEFHRLVGETLESIFADQLAQHCEVLAYHFSRSDDRDKAIQYLDMAGQQARRQFANETALRLCTALLDMLGEDEATWTRRFDTLDRRQQIYALLGRQPEREADVRAMQELTERHDDVDRRGNAINALADLYQWTGRYEEALKIAEEALQIEQKTGDRAGQASALHTLGVVHYYRGDYKHAEPALVHATKLRRDGGDPAGESWSELYLTMIHLVSGNYGAADQHNEDALKAAASRQDWMLMGIHLNNGARIALRLGEYEAALERFTQSLEMRGRVGDRTGQGFTLHGMGLVHTYLGRYDDAEKSFRASMDIRQSINDERGVSHCHAGLGLVALGRGDLAWAEQHFQKARDMHERLELRSELAADLSFLGQRSEERRV